MNYVIMRKTQSGGYEQVMAGSQHFTDEASAERKCHELLARFPQQSFAWFREIGRVENRTEPVVTKAAA